jgi:hypothetical protein
MFLKRCITKSFAALILAGSLSSAGLAEERPELPPAKPREYLAERLEEPAYKNYTHDKYAVLMRGEEEKRYVTNFSIAYQVLLEQGFKPENIYVLAPHLTEKRRRTTRTLENHFFHPTDGAATEENLKKVLGYLAKKADKKDTLLLYLNDHGSVEWWWDDERLYEDFGILPWCCPECILNICGADPEEYKIYGESYFCLPGPDTIKESELEEYLKDMDVNGKIFIFDFCKSGGFAERFGKGNAIAISTAPRTKKSHSKTHDSLSGHIFAAFRPNSNADQNNDRQVSIPEAFEYAKKHHYVNIDGRDDPQFKYGIDPKTVTLKHFPPTQPKSPACCPPRKKPLRRLLGF